MLLMVGRSTSEMPQDPAYSRFLASFEEISPLFRMSAADVLQEAYGEPGRVYHNTEHLLMLLRLFARLRDFAQDPLAVKAAIFFHDAIYHIPQDAEYPLPQDNESRSVQLMRAQAINPHHPSLVRAEACIMATVNHTTSQDRDVCLLHDIDLYVLAASRQRFIRFEQQIHREYSVYPLPLYTAGRMRILRGFLEQRSIYAIEALEKLWGEKARANLNWAINELSAGRVPGA